MHNRLIYLSTWYNICLKMRIAATWSVHCRKGHLRRLRNAPWAWYPCQRQIIFTCITMYLSLELIWHFVIYVLIFELLFWTLELICESWTTFRVLNLKSECHPCNMTLLLCFLCFDWSGLIGELPDFEKQVPHRPV